MGTRQVVPRFWDNEDLADLEAKSGQPKLRLALIGLWAASDATGRFEWRPRMLATKIFPFNLDDQATLEDIMENLATEGFVLKYQVEDKWYGAHPHWGEHNDFRKADSEYPPPPRGLGGIIAPQSPEKPLEGKGEIESKGHSKGRTAQIRTGSSQAFGVND